MTFVVVAMIDVGALLVLSAWENVSLQQTWAALLGGKLPTPGTIFGPSQTPGPGGPIPGGTPILPV